MSIFSIISPVAMAIVNSAFVNGVVPASFKHAIVQLFWKKNLDPAVCSNYRPIFKFPSITKLLEKVVFLKLQSSLDSFNIFQSCFR